jgi:hypothetical protein
VKILLNSFNYENHGTYALHTSWFKCLEKYVAIEYVGKGFPVLVPNEDYDVFLIYTMKHFESRVNAGKAFRVLFILDRGAAPDMVRTFCKKYNIQLLVTRYCNNLEIMKEELKIPVVYLPWSFDSTAFYNSYQPRTINLSFLGTTHGTVYHDRLLLKDLMTAIPRSVFLGGLRDFGSLIVKETANVYCRSKISVSVASSRDFLLAKYFEIPACQAMLLCQDVPGLKDIFTDSDSCVLFNKDFSDFYEKYAYYLTHEDQREFIAQRGYDLVHNKHTHEIRAKEFIEILKRYV